MAPGKEVLQSSSQKYVHTIKAKHHEEELNRRDRKARRRQALAQQHSKLQVLSSQSLVQSPIGGQHSSDPVLAKH